MKKEIILTVNNSQGSYQNNDNIHMICFEGVLKILGSTPLRIKVTVSDVNPKKKGWQTFRLIRPIYVDFHGNHFKRIFLSAGKWLYEQFPNTTRLYFKIEEA